MTEPDRVGTTTEGASARFLTFLTADRLYALPADEVAEVIRLPPLAKVPQGPTGLLGIANLRGEVLPVASLRGLLGQAAGALTPASRALVLTGSAPVALAVDAVEALVAVPRDQVETAQAHLAAGAGERLVGAFRWGEGDTVAKVLDIRSLLTGAFAPRARAARALAPASSDRALDLRTAETTRLITFEVAGQEYGLALEAVREVISAPQSLSRLPDSDALALGVAPYRDSLLPLFSLAGLLGLPQAPWDPLQKVVVTTVGAARVGLAVERMRAVLTLYPDQIEPTPPALAARAGGESRIKALYSDGDARLVLILDPNTLFREDVMQRLGQTAAPDEGGTAQAAGEAAQFLVFRLEGEEFALPIGAVEEVARVPDQIARLPKTPAFLEGVVNLRGEVLPVIDQRRRFDMAPLETLAGRRLVVVRTERHRAGLIVDAVVEVLRCRQEAVGEAPDIAGDAARLVNGVINLETEGRLVLVLDPAELLSRTERQLLDRLKLGGSGAGV